MAKLKSGSHQFAGQYGQQICDFLGEAQIKYASGEIRPATTEGGSSMIVYENGIWRYSDVWHGGEPYGGITTIARDGVDCFTMVYFGRVMPYAEKELVLQDLMEALQHPNPAAPWRGPHECVTTHGLRYYNKWSGSVRRFSGDERIMSQDGKKTLYEASYMGGIVNQD